MVIDADDDDALAAAIAASMQAAAAPGAAPASAASSAMDTSEPEAAPELVPPPVSEGFLATLGEMGIPENRARRALFATSSVGVQQAFDWLEAHQDDVDIDTPLLVRLPVPGATTGSGSDDDLSMEASRHVGLTEEQRAAKVEELRKKIAARKAERAIAEKEAERLREIKRREDGQKAIETARELEALQRKRDMEKLKKEKEAAAKEKQRLLAEIAKDKAERRARMGLPPEPVKPAAASGVAAPLSNEAQLAKAIETLSQYKVGGEGLRALKTLRVYVNNALEHPTEDKFQRVNLANEAFKTRVGAFVGGIPVLKCAGFVKNEAENAMVVERDEAKLRLALSKLDEAIRAIGE